jgi:uncharacterized protein YjlB
MKMALRQPIITYGVKPTKLIPNSTKPLLNYKGCFSRKGKFDPILAYDTLKGHGWDVQWVTKYGRHQRSHYHAESHETMVVLSGSGVIRWGVADLSDDLKKTTYGDAYEGGGIEMDAKVGDVFVIPAGIAHKSYNPHSTDYDFKRLTGEARVIEPNDFKNTVEHFPSTEFIMMGAYPHGYTWTWGGEGGEHGGQFESVWAVPKPELDPVLGDEGGTCKYW